MTKRNVQKLEAIKKMIILFSENSHLCLINNLFHYHKEKYTDSAPAFQGNEASLIVVSNLL